MGSPNEDEMHAIPRPRFDATLNWGHVVIVVAFMVTSAAQWYLNDYRLRSLEDQLKSGLANLGTLVVASARQDERLIELKGRVDRLERMARP